VWLFCCLSPTPLHGASTSSRACRGRCALQAFARRDGPALTRILLHKRRENAHCGTMHRIRCRSLYRLGPHALIPVTVPYDVRNPLETSVLVKAVDNDRIDSIDCVLIRASVACHCRDAAARHCFKPRASERLVVRQVHEDVITPQNARDSGPRESPVVHEVEVALELLERLACRVATKDVEGHFSVKTLAQPLENAHRPVGSSPRCLRSNHCAHPRGFADAACTRKIDVMVDAGLDPPHV